MGSVQRSGTHEAQLLNPSLPLFPGTCLPDWNVYGLINNNQLGGFIRCWKWWLSPPINAAPEPSCSFEGDPATYVRNLWNSVVDSRRHKAVRNNPATRSKVLEQDKARQATIRSKMSGKGTPKIKRGRLEALVDELEKRYGIPPI